MKRYEDYTTKELANLTEEEIKTLIEIECMVNGIAACYEKPDLKPIEELPQPDIEVFEVCDIKFLDKEEAIALLELIRNSKSIVITDYDYSVGYSERYVKPDTDCATLSSSKYYSKEAYDSMKEAIKCKKEAEQHNREMTEIYNKRMEEYRKLESEVNSAVYEAVAEESKFNYAKSVFERYVSMADGNIDVAKNFFEKTEYSYLLPRILEEGTYNAGN